MRHTTKLLICIALCVIIYLCTPSVRACGPSGPCYSWNPRTEQWVPYGCVATPCADGCTTCDLETCACECEVTIDTAESDVDVQGVGLDIIFTMTTSPTSRYECVSWSGGGDPATGDGSSFTTDWDTPGDKTVTVKTCDEDGDSEDIEVTIVGVDWVEPDHDDAVEVDDGDEDDDTELWLLGVQESGNVDVEAKPDPDVLEEPGGELPICWSYVGTEGTKSSDVIYELDATDPIVASFTASSGESSKTTVLRLVKVNMTISGLDEEDEDDPGACVALNNNDDDDDGVEDLIDGSDEDGSLDEVPPQPNDDDENLYESDLLAVSLSVQAGTPLPPEGAVKLEIVEDSGDGSFKLWANAEKGKGNEIELASYDLSDTTEGGDRDKITSYLANGVCIEGTSTGSCTFKLSFIAGGKTMHSDTIKITVVELDIEEVPAFLYASATYATPITFKVDGLGSGGTAYIHNISAKLYEQEGSGPDTLLGGPFAIGERFTADGGIIRDNGNADTYTGYVPASSYAGITVRYDVEGEDEITHRTDKAYFVLDVQVSLTEDSHQLSICSRRFADDEQAEMKLFADSSIFAAEPGIGATVYSDWYIKNFADSSQAPIQLDTPKGEYQHCVNPDNGPDSPYSKCPPGVHTCMDPDGTLPWYFQQAYYDEARTCENVTSGAPPTVCGKKLYTKLGQFAGAPWMYGHNVHKNRLYGWRKGGYFCPSYGGIELHVDDPLDPDDEPSILAGDEYAMDLNIVSGEYDWHLFDSGYKYLHTEARADDGINAGGCAALCAGAAVAMVWPVGTFWAAGQTATYVFGVASAAFWAIDSIDNEASIQDCAESVFYCRHTKTPWQGAPTETHGPGEALETDGTTQGTVLVIKTATWVVGDTYQFFIELESACAMELSEWFPLNKDINSEAKFYCNGIPTVISAQDDWNTWRIRLRTLAP